MRVYCLLAPRLSRFHERGKHTVGKTIRKSVAREAILKLRKQKHALSASSGKHIERLYKRCTLDSTIAVPLQCRYAVWNTSLTGVFSYYHLKDKAYE